MQITVKDLRIHTKELLDTALQGEEVIITYRGKPWAKLVPIQTQRTDESEDDHHLFGIWKDRDDMQDVEEYLRNLRRGRFA